MLRGYTTHVFCLIIERACRRLFNGVPLNDVPVYLEAQPRFAGGLDVSVDRPVCWRDEEGLQWNRVDLNPLAPHVAQAEVHRRRDPGAEEETG